jgi:PAS domain S-box-containing protein
MTDSGVPPIGVVPWGTHFCHFYETSGDILHTAVAYFGAGLEAGQLCFWVTSDPGGVEGAKAALIRRLPAAASALANDHLQVVSAWDWYLQDGAFRPEVVAKAWGEKAQYAIENGHGGLRVLADEAWLTRDTWADFACYETGLNEALGQQKLIVLCAYPLNHVSGLEVFDVADSHEFAVACRHGEWKVMEAAERIGERAEARRQTSHLWKAVEKRTEQLAAVNEALVDREELFAVMTESMSDIVSLYEPDGTRVYISPSAVKVIGEPPLRSFEGIHPEDRPVVEKTWRRILAGETQTTIFRHKHADGSWRWLEARGTPVVYRGREHVLAVSRDVTERMALEDKLHHAQKMEALGRLAGGVAHDFNNVLTAIFGYTSLLTRQLGTDQAARIYVDEIKAAAERARRLTRQLLAFSRRDAHEPRIVDVAAVVRNVERMLRLVVSEGIELTIETPADHLPTYIDPVQLEQVLVNLVVNARDATPPGGRIDVRTDSLVDAQRESVPHYVEPGSYVRLVVKDTGSGMTPDIADRIFEPFFTTKAAGQGTGLGLSMALAIVKQAKGFIWAETAPGEGSTFSILLPCHSADSETAGLFEEQAGGYRFDGLTVAILEDEEPVRRLVVDVLEQAGASVLAFANPEEALIALGDRRRKVDVLISDVVLPALSGTTVARLIRQVHPRLKVLFMSGYSAERAEIAALANTSGLLEKPFDAEALLHAMAALTQQEQDGTPPPASH